MGKFWLLTGAGLVRAAVIAAGEWLVVAAPPNPSMTDIDYLVVVEAACLRGRPSERLTYRYSPLLAALLRPACRRGWRWFGKAVYGAADVLATAVSHPGDAAVPWRHRVLWLFNPFVVALSTRGSFDALVQLVVAGAVRLSSAGFFGLAGGLVGLATHLRLYPVVFVPFFALRAGSSGAAVRLVVVAGLGCLGCTVVAQRFDPRFVEVGVLHHVLGRLDHRHNLSALWPLQLQCSRDGRSGVACFPFAPVAQLVGLAFLFLHRLRRLRFSFSRRYTTETLCGDLAAAAVVFVALNPVVTAQYYAWALFPASLGARPPARALLVALALLHLLWLRLAFSVEFGAADAAPLPVVSAALCVLAALAAVRLATDAETG